MFRQPFTLDSTISCLATETLFLSGGSESINLLVSYWTIGSGNATVRVNLWLRMRMETVSERQRDVTETEIVVDKGK